MLIRPSHGCWVEVATTTSILTGRPVRSSIISIRIVSATVKVIPDFRLDCSIAWADRVDDLILSRSHFVIRGSRFQEEREGAGRPGRLPQFPFLATSPRAMSIHPKAGALTLRQTACICKHLC